VFIVLSGKTIFTTTTTTTQQNVGIIGFLIGFSSDFGNTS
jgi:hypothetical protein